MKKIILILASILLMLVPMQSWAYSNTHDVSAKYNYYNKDNYYTSNIIDGSGKVEINKEISISINGDIPDGYNLVVHEILRTEKDAYEWFEKIVNNKFGKFIPYDIYLINLENERVELPLNIQIRISNNSKNAKIYSIKRNTESLLELSTTYEKGNIIFNSIDSSYYLLTINKFAEKSPKTGDFTKNNIWCYNIIICLSIASIILIKKRDN